MKLLVIGGKNIEDSTFLVAFHHKQVFENSLIIDSISTQILKFVSKEIFSLEIVELVCEGVDQEVSLDFDLTMLFDIVAKLTHLCTKS